MYLTKSYDFHRRDFRGDLKCEHCGDEELSVTCYDDSNFHQRVIPGKECKSCKQSTTDAPGKVPVASGPRDPDHVVK